jgi:Protein of unknown function (DUF3237)
MIVEPCLEHIFSADLLLASEMIGPVTEGIRINFHVVSGEVTGPKFQGKFHPVGGDWLIFHSNGVATLDIRVTIETTDGALIYNAVTAVLDAGEGGYEQFVRQKPPRGALRGASRHSSSHPNYLWLNRLQFAGFGEVNLVPGHAKIRFDFYALR